MSDRPTSTDLMAALDDLRGDVKRLLGSAQDHERRLDSHDVRLAQLESVGVSLRQLIECNNHMVRELTKVREEVEAHHGDITRAVETSVRADLLEMRRDLRGDMVGLRSDVVALTRRLDARPCVLRDSTECPMPDEAKE